PRKRENSCSQIKRGNPCVQENLPMFHKSAHDFASET
ncbi:hypothetical protein X975_26742, partial [Stegodyphus mimosarum]